ncbi:CIC11C00000004915 [Sungouiella intermedia]|uniref:CIC11C00000004915 n=1 Tax=Sungouiella intermedia TaxID=45354 RepID=A0A1L0BDQ4_9ASCO|nr:CIC11C00000004915 [[Candida] intermedia]
MTKLNLTTEQQASVDGTISFILNSQRSPILRRPDELGMEYQDIFFPALDGVNLEGWFIPTKSSSNKLVICNHFMPGNRYGFAGHLPQY